MPRRRQVSPNQLNNLTIRSRAGDDRRSGIERRAIQSQISLDPSNFEREGRS
jgi:hypothetical protein